MSAPSVVEALLCGVIVPMFNEEANAERCVRGISAVLRCGAPGARIIAVNDGSSDGTGAALARLREAFPELVVETHDRNRGYGTAVRTGIAAARREGMEYALFMDADLTTDPKYLPAFLEKMREGHDVIKATRYSDGGGMAGVPFHRSAISRVGNLVARNCFRLPISDCTNAFRAIRVELLAKLPLREPGFAVVVEELYRVSALASTYAEVPHVLTSRRPGEGASHFAYRPKVFLQYLRYAVLALIRRHVPPRLRR